MRFRGLKIEVITDLRGIMSPESVTDMLKHIQHKKPFAIIDDRLENFYVCFPDQLKLVAWTKDEFIYDSLENFIDGIKLKLITFPNFTSCAAMITEPQKAKLIGNK